MYAAIMATEAAKTAQKIHGVSKITPTIINPVTSGKPNFLRYELR